MNRLFHRRRRGMVATVEFIFIFPLFVAVGLIIFQFLLIHAAYTPVQFAALEGARVASVGGTIEEIEDAVGLALGYLAVGPGAAHISSAGEVVGFEVIREFVDTDNNGTISACSDYVAVGVRIPMNRVSTNYLGLLCGGSVDGLQLRSVAKMALTCACNNGGNGQCELTTANCTICQLIIENTVCYVNSIVAINPPCRQQLVDDLNLLSAEVCADPADNAGHCARLATICNTVNNTPCSNSLNIVDRIEIVGRLNQIAACICCDECELQ